MRNLLQTGFVVLLLLFSGCMAPREPEIIGTEYRDPPSAPNFNLINQDGANISLSDFQGKVIVVAFIYTSCPDVCLIISSNLDYVRQNLGEHADDVELISITIDPARDTVPHLKDWTDARGYGWNHLTHHRGSVIQAVWDEWKVVVDADHIANSLPPEDATVRFSVLFPDNTTLVTNNPCRDLQNMTCYEDGVEFAEYALRTNADITYEIENGTIGEWTSNDSWNWELYVWGANFSWEPANREILGNGVIDHQTHMAWVASNSNASELPPGVDCDGHGWIMGTGGGAHCMCDEGWDRPDDDWLSCVVEGNVSSHGNETNPHEESLGEYEVGHSTVTFIIDKDQRKRVAYSGIMWDVESFLQDVKTLAEE